MEYVLAVVHAYLQIFTVLRNKLCTLLTHYVYMCPYKFINVLVTYMSCTCFWICSGRIEVNQNNLAYITVLFPESEIVREHIREPRPRRKTLVTSWSETTETATSYNILLSSHAVPSMKLQILFLYVLVSSCGIRNHIMYKSHIMQLC